MVPTVERFLALPGIARRRLARAALDEAIALVREGEELRAVGLGRDAIGVTELRDEAQRRGWAIEPCAACSAPFHVCVITRPVTL